MFEVGCAFVLRYRRLSTVHAVNTSLCGVISFLLTTSECIINLKFSLKDFNFPNDVAMENYF